MKMWTKLPRVVLGKGLKGRILALPLAKNRGRARKMVGKTPIEKDFYKGKFRMIEYKNKIIIAVGVSGKSDARNFGALAWDAVNAFMGPVKFHLIPDFLPEEAVLEGALLSSYKFSRYFSKKKEEPWIVFHGSERARENALIKARATFIARDITNEPPNAVYPESLAEISQKLFEETNVEVEIHSYEWLKQNGFGGIVAVGKGSEKKPCMIVMKYLPRKSAKPVLLVGKGVTFDSGGIHLKPTGFIETMKTDMGGGAAVIGSIYGISKLGLRRNVVGIVPVVENMPSGEATKPGDVVKMFNKKTVEVWNTDAEGRLILADALAYGIKKFKPDAALDLATLTGACVIALGERVAGVMSRSGKLVEELHSAGKKVEEEIWELPMTGHYAEAIRSDVADVRNCAEKGYGGAIVAAKFLENFARGDWAHIDMAGPGNSKSSWLWHPKGGTGFGTRLVIEWVKSHSQ